MGLRSVHHVVNPAPGLLDSDGSPFSFSHKPGLGCQSGEFLWKDDVPKRRRAVRYAFLGFNFRRVQREAEDTSANASPHSPVFELVVIVFV